MYRIALAVALAFVAGQGRAATISLGGDFHLTEPAPGDKLIVTTSTAFVSRSLAQLPLDQRHTFNVPANQLFFLHFLNLSRSVLGDRERSMQLHFGKWLSEAPNAYQNATTLEMIGGPIVDLGSGKLAQQWTYIVDGVPETVQVAIVPEPACCVMLLAGLTIAQLTPGLRSRAT